MECEKGPRDLKIMGHEELAAIGKAADQKIAESDLALLRETAWRFPERFVEPSVDELAALLRQRRAKIMDLMFERGLARPGETRAGLASRFATFVVAHVIYAVG